MKPNKHYKWFTNTFLSYLLFEDMLSTVHLEYLSQVFIKFYCSSFYQVQGNWPVKIFQIFWLNIYFFFLRFSNLSILTYYLYILASKFCAIFRVMTILTYWYFSLETSYFLITCIFFARKLIPFVGVVRLAYFSFLVL